MPSFSTNIIKASYNGDTTTVHYWADGHGRRVDGYVTSLAQLKTTLGAKFRVRALALYSVVDRRLKPITTDKHLMSAIADLRRGGTLLINVYKHDPVDSVGRRRQERATSKTYTRANRSPLRHLNAVY